MMINPIVFRYLANVTIPSVYGDALSYQEEIGILAAKINEVIDQFNGLSGEEIEAVISAYLTPEKIQEILDESFGAAIDEKITANNADYYDKDATDAEISTAIAGEVADRNSAIAAEAARAAAVELAITNNLANNYYNKAAVDAAIEAAIPDLSTYATMEDVIDTVDANISLEVTNRNAAIDSAISTNNANYYTKSQVDQKDSNDKAYADAGINSLADNINAKLGLVSSRSFSSQAGSAWTNTYNNVHAKYSDYAAGVTSDLSNLFCDVSYNPVGESGGICHLHGYITPVSSSTINAGSSTAFAYVPFSCITGSGSECRVMAQAIDISTGVVLPMPLSLVPTEQGDTIICYKNISSSATPSFGASNKRIYLEASFTFNNSSLA